MHRKKSINVIAIRQPWCACDITRLTKTEKKTIKILSIDHNKPNSEQLCAKRSRVCTSFSNGINLHCFGIYSFWIRFAANKIGELVKNLACCAPTCKIQKEDGSAAAGCKKKVNLLPSVWRHCPSIYYWTNVRNIDPCIWVGWRTALTF